MAVAVAVVWPVLEGRTFSESLRLQSTLPPWSGYPPAVGQGGFIIHYDQFYSYFPWQVFMSAAERAHRFVSWNPDEFLGTPFFANGQNGFLYPPRLLLAALVTPLRVHDGLIAFHVLAAGLTAYAMFIGFGLRRGAATLGASAWMTNSFFLTWLGLEAFGSTGALLPLLVLLAWRIATRRDLGAAVWLSVSTALAVVGGSILYWEIALLIALLLGLAAAGVAAAQARISRTELAARVTLLGGAFAVGVGMAAVQVLPTLELVDATARVPLSYHGLISGRLPLGVLSSVVAPPAVDLSAGFLHSPYHVMLFAGTPTVALALVGFWRRSLLNAFGLILVVVGLAVMLGSPLAWIPYRLVPGFDNFRPLARLAFVFIFGLVILAACGADALGRRFASSSRRRRRALALLGAASVALIVVQNVRVGREVLPSQSAAPAAVVPATPLVEALRTSGAETRVLAIAPAFPASTMLIYGVSNVGGYESLPPARQVSVLRALAGMESVAAIERTPIPTSFSTTFITGYLREDLLARLAITRVVAPRDPRQVAQLQVGGYLGPPTYSSTDGAILPVLHPSARVELQAGCRSLAPGADELADFVAAATRPRPVALTGTEARRLGLACGARADAPAVSGGTATVEERGQTSVSVRVDAKGSALLVVRDAWFPGWHATVDGHETPVARGDDIFRVIRVPAGAHRVVLTYRPRSLRVGLAVSAISTLILVAFAAGALVRPRFLRRRRGARIAPIGDPLRNARGAPTD